LLLRLTDVGKIHPNELKNCTTTIQHLYIEIPFGKHRTPDP
jgi:hypothetical protein